jgi:hypothetical protein
MSRGPCSPARADSLDPMRFLLLILLLTLPLIATAHAGTWVPAGKGDCPGPQVFGSAGVEPEAEHCTSDFIGKTALCFTQVCYPGCQYIDVPTRECRGGTELADIYTCVAAPPAGGAAATPPAQP